MMNEAELQQLSALAAKASQQVNTAVLPVPTPTGPEPGYTTTEFWTTIGATVVAFVAVFHPGFTAPPALAQAFAAGAAGIAQAGYAIGRSLRKKGT